MPVRQERDLSPKTVVLHLVGRIFKISYWNPMPGKCGRSLSPRKNKGLRRLHRAKTRKWKCRHQSAENIELRAPTAAKLRKMQTNLFAHNKKLALPPPPFPENPNTPPPLKQRILWAWGFSSRKNPKNARRPWKDRRIFLKNAGIKAVW